MARLLSAMLLLHTCVSPLNRSRQSDLVDSPQKIVYDWKHRKTSRMVFYTLCRISAELFGTTEIGDIFNVCD